MSSQSARATRAGASACQARPRQWTVPLALLLDDAASGDVVLQQATDDGQMLARVTVQARDLPAAVAERAAGGARPRARPGRGRAVGEGAGAGPGLGSGGAAGPGLRGREGRVRAQRA